MTLRALLQILLLSFFNSLAFAAEVRLASYMELAKQLDRLDQKAISAFQSGIPIDAADTILSIQNILAITDKIRQLPESNQAESDQLRDLSNFYYDTRVKKLASELGKNPNVISSNFINYRRAAFGLLTSLELPKNEMERVLEMHANELIKSVRSSPTYPTANKMYFLAQGTSSAKNLNPLFANYNELSNRELLNLEGKILKQFPKLSDRFYSSLPLSQTNVVAPLGASEGRSYFIKAPIDPTKFRYADPGRRDDFDRSRPLAGPDLAYVQNPDNHHFLDLKYEILAPGAKDKVVTLGKGGPLIILSSDEFNRLTSDNISAKTQPNTIEMILPAPQEQHIDVPKAIPVPRRDPAPQANPVPVPIHKATPRQQPPNPPSPAQPTPTNIPTYNLSYKVKQANPSYPNLKVGSVLKLVAEDDLYTFQDLNTEQKYRFKKHLWQRTLSAAIDTREPVEVIENQKKPTHKDAPTNDKPTPTPVRQISQSELDFFKKPNSGELIAEKMTQIRKEGKSNVKNFREIFQPLAEHIYQLTGFPPDVLLAQKAIESTWGTSNVLSKTNNTSGISCYEEGEVRTAIIKFTDPPTTVRAVCKHPRPRKEDENGKPSFYLVFENVYESTLYQTWNLLYNKNQEENYKDAREAAKKIRLAENSAKAIEQQTNAFITGMGAWAKDDNYLDLVKEVHRLFKRSPYDSSPESDTWVEVPGLESYAKKIEELNNE